MLLSTVCLLSFQPLSSKLDVQEMEALPISYLQDLANEQDGERENWEGLQATSSNILDKNRHANSAL
jgi:hypothetical protein